MSYLFTFSYNVQSCGIIIQDVQDLTGSWGYSAVDTSYFSYPNYRTLVVSGTSGVTTIIRNDVSLTFRTHEYGTNHYVPRFDITDLNSGENISYLLVNRGYTSNGTVLVPAIFNDGEGRKIATAIILSSSDFETATLIPPYGNQMGIGSVRYATLNIYKSIVPTSGGSFTSEHLATATTLLNKWLTVPTGYDIDFVTNGGTSVESLSGQTTLPDPLPTTTREGFTFNGWYTDSSLIFPAVPGAEIEDDTTLYAGWRPNQFTVTFETNGGEPVSQLTNVNQLPDPLPVTFKDGNDFAGWFIESEFIHPAVPGAFISQNTTLYAKWIEHQSTDIHVPPVSAPSLLQTGFVTMWQPTLEEVRELADFLWTSNLIDNLRKLFNDPMEAILFLGIVPFDVVTSERGNIFFGNLDTEVESSPVIQQYYNLDFGDIDMTEYYHSFLDYEPATTVEIFLPFCGTHKLSANEVMGSVMNLKYNVDVFTGTCLAMLTITKPGIDSVMYSFEGNLMSIIPVTAKNYSDFIRTAVSAVASTMVMGAIL